MPLILEGLVTTLNADGSVNLSPMGPIVDREITRLTLRPFQSSRTYANLKRFGEGVFHITDDVELLARAAIDEWAEPPSFVAAGQVTGAILQNACRWFAFRVRESDDRDERTRLECEVIERGRSRDFFGFNRAQHAVLEAAILATRIGILPDQQIRDEYQRLATLVEKTGGDQERRAWELLESHVRRRLGVGS